MLYDPYWCQVTCFRGAGLPARSQNISVVMCVVVCFKGAGLTACSQNISVVMCVVVCFKAVSYTHLTLPTKLPV